ncbi:MAG: ATP-dependent zinc metalloprotease FtsH [Sedimentisphaerales bacterium]|nr:ATP-dependent zinc metalloprotease FtsH [Sedimentisphaerales bacterium]
MYSWILLLMLAGMLFLMLKDVGQRAEVIDMTEFRQRIRNREVKQVVVMDASLEGEMKPEAMAGKDPKSPAQFKVELGDGVAEQEWFVRLLDECGVHWSYKRESGLWQMFRLILPWLLILAVMYFFIFRQFKGASGAGMLGSFGRSRHRVTTREQSKVTFANVAGIDEAKEEVQEIILFLRNPKKFQRLGGRIPRGILLIGEPGCGKTLLAKAIAGEADVPFFSISGSDFVEMFVGVGASRVRDLFKQAKDNSPCIIFLDEIDAVGRKRGTSIAGGGHDEREQTLNAILVEMDGFETDDQVIVIAATNRPDVLDRALTRPGRFDRQIFVPLPDLKGRMEILKVHAKKVRMGPDVDLHRMARGTPMFSGADLEAIINEAALAATLAEKDYIEMADLEEARDKVRWGRARRSRMIDDKEKEAIAVHESGHALVQSLLEDADPVHKVSIIPRGHMGGATFSLPEKDRTMYTKRFCLAMIRVTFGGRVAEELFCGDISSGAQGDIQQATELARRMVMDWGMSEKLGFVRYGAEEMPAMFGEMMLGREYSDRTAETIDNEIKIIMDAAYAEVKTLLQEHREQLIMLKEALVKYETLDGEEVQQIISGRKLDKPTVGDLLAAEQKRTPPAKTAEGGVARTESARNGLTGPMPQPGMG